MYSIDVRKTGRETSTVELWGEFDMSSLDALRETLNAVTDLRKLTLVDLSEVTFLDIRSARELAVYSRLHGQHLTLHDPSWQAQASFETCGLKTRLRFGRDHADSPLVLAADQPDRVPQTEGGDGVRCNDLGPPPV